MLFQQEIQVITVTVFKDCTEPKHIHKTTQLKTTGKLNTCFSQAKAKSAHEPSGPSGRSLSRFLYHEVTRNISTPPPSTGWDASALQDYPALNSPIPIYTPGWREALCE